MMSRKIKPRLTQRRDSLVFDPWILFPVLALMAIGLLMVASASMVVSDHYYANSFHFVIRQGVYLFLALTALWLVSRVKSVIWQKSCFLLLLLSLFFLVIVLVPGIGRVINGSRRWIAFPFFTFQVSELAKLVAILCMANYISRQFETLKTRMASFVRPLIVLAVMVVLLLLEPDFGTVAVIMLTMLCLLFLAGAPLAPFILIALLVGLGLLAMVWFSPYRFNRLVSFLDPWSTQFGSGYQLTQSLIAFGRGGIDGVGLGNSMQKLFYLPEAHTDFLFAVFCEEFGLIGALVTISLYGCLIWRLFWWASKMIRVNKLFSGYFCYGIGLWIAFQAAINMGVTVGLLPTKGLTLPFVSYGGTSLIIFSAAIGLVLRMVAESRSMIKQGRASWEKSHKNLSRSDF
jgi:cell division protein FtsW